MAVRTRAGKAGVSRLALLAAALAAVPGAWLLMPRGAPAASAAEGRGGDCLLWFVGSSSVARWDTLARDMRPWAVDNRGIPGATLAQIVDRLAAARGEARPQGIVVYGGDNDLAGGDDPAAVVRGFDRLIARRSDLFGAVPLLLIAIKPSPARWEQRPRQRAVNLAIRRLAARRANVALVDVAPDMLARGRPRALFADDGLHLNADGYRLWTVAVRRALRARLPARVVARCAPEEDGA